MMTQKTPKQQEFDALLFELKHSRDFETTKNQHIEYEIDSVEDEFGKLFRVWNRRILVGTFHQKLDPEEIGIEEDRIKWLANPFYESKKWVRADRNLSKIFNCQEQAVAYIKAKYELKVSLIAV